MCLSAFSIFILAFPFISRYRSDCRNVAFTEVIFIIHPPPEHATWSHTSPPMVGNTARFKYSGSSVLRLSESSFKAAPLGRAGWPQDATQPSDAHIWRMDGSDEPYQLLVCANQQWNSGFTFWSTDKDACAPQASAFQLHYVVCAWALFTSLIFFLLGCYLNLCSVRPVALVLCQHIIQPCVFCVFLVQQRQRKFANRDCLFNHRQASAVAFFSV
jgi:hypothetical protein